MKEQNKMNNQSSTTNTKPGNTQQGNNPNRGAPPQQKWDQNQSQRGPSASTQQKKQPWNQDQNQKGTTEK